MPANVLIQPLGDHAINIRFDSQAGDVFDTRVLTAFRSIKASPPFGMLDAIPTFNTLTVFFDPMATCMENIKKNISALLEGPGTYPGPPREFVIPVCYDTVLGMDLGTTAAMLNLSPAELIGIHCSRTYQVCMLGFLPGFPYLASVAERIACPRKEQPVTVKAGSVGIAGVQTGIYPFDSPGGWNIIARTPLKMFDAGRTEPALLGPGDTVRFEPISIEEFNRLA